MTITVKLPGEHRMLRELKAIRRELAELREHVTDTSEQIRKELSQMAGTLKSDFDTLVRLMDQETSAVATRVDDLTAQARAAFANSDGLSATDAQTILSGFQGISARLKSLGANPADPVPGGVGAAPTPAETPAATGASIPG